MKIRLVLAVFLFTICTGTLFANNSLLEVREALVRCGLTHEEATRVSGKMRKIPTGDKVASVCEWLQNQGIKDLARVFSIHPGLFSVSVDNNLDRKTQWLRSLGVTNIAYVIERAPNVFTYSIEDNLEPKMKWLREHGVENLGVMIEREPRCLGDTIEKFFEPRFNWLRELGVQNIGRFFEVNINNLAMDIEKQLNPRVQFLRDQGIKNVGKFLERYPPILGLSIEGNLRPTFFQLKEVWKISIEEIENRPMLLGASESRVRTVAQELQQVGYDIAQLPLKPRMAAFNQVGIREVLKHLRSVGAIRMETNSLANLSETERAAVQRLISNGAFDQVLKRILPAYGRELCVSLLRDSSKKP